MKKMEEPGGGSLLSEDIKFFFNMVKSKPEDEELESLDIKNGKPSPRFGKKSLAKRRRDLREGKSKSRAPPKSRLSKSRTRTGKRKDGSVLNRNQLKEARKPRRKTPIRNSDRAVVKKRGRKNSIIGNGRNGDKGERKKIPQASKSPSRPPLSHKCDNYETISAPKTPKKVKRWEMLYNMANSKSKAVKSKTPRKHVQLSKEKDRYHAPRSIRTPRTHTAQSRENSREKVKPFHLRMVPKSPSVRKKSKNKRKDSGFTYERNRDKSTKKKRRKKNKFNDLFQHGTYHNDSGVEEETQF
jgi:hypothetical protein